MRGATVINAGAARGWAVLATDATPAFGIARTHWFASSPAIPDAEQARTYQLKHTLHPTDGGALWSGGVSPHTPSRPASRSIRIAEAGAALANDASSPRDRRRDTDTLRAGTPRVGAQALAAVLALLPGRRDAQVGHAD
jgi:hypothetical protein